MFIKWDTKTISVQGQETKKTREVLVAIMCTSLIRTITHFQMR